MKKIIAFFVGIVLLWDIHPAFGGNCQKGEVLVYSGGGCIVCPAGTYSNTENATSCTNCPSPYTQTWSGNEANNHDNIADCLILVKFHAKGGKYKAPNDVEKTDATVGAHYNTRPDTEYVDSCPLPVSGSAPYEYLCKNNSKKFKISENANSVWTRDGYTFAGWFKDEAFTDPLSYTETFAAPLNLYAKWCEDAANVVPKDGECVCKRGYYMNGTECTKCPDGSSTVEPGAKCEKVFHYKVGSDDKFWAWPNAVTSVEFYEENIK